MQFGIFTVGDVTPDPEETRGMAHRTTSWLNDHVQHLRDAPAEIGTLELVVRRPENGEREVLEAATLDEVDGLVGDNWYSRATSHAIAEGRHLEAQINVMSARMVGLLADDDEGRALAGDQLYLDLDLSHANLRPGRASSSASPRSSR